MSIRERANKAGGETQHKLPDGKAKETKFPKANPGQLPYLIPRAPGPKVSTNES